MFRRLAVLLLSLALGGCGTVYDQPVVRGPATTISPQVNPGRRDLAEGVAEYRVAARRIEAQSETMCLEADGGSSPRRCVFGFLLVDDPRIGPNAFQTVDRAGRPIVAMTVQLVAETRNADEIAFILGHEAAHHIVDHIARTQTQAMTGAMVLGTLATLGNASDDVISDMMDLGASLGGRAYSQSYELEADRLGAFIAARAGYDPERGARVFARPVLAGGGGLLSTHPASAQRQAAVAATAAEIRRQQSAGYRPDPNLAARALLN
ncbi:MAG: M48 family metalloprotease [Rhodobacteraceae bacterium]|nr:M48 family metalloprotease [Paracoccaceae bacterium]